MKAEEAHPIEQTLEYWRERAFRAEKHAKEWMDEYTKARDKLQELEHRDIKDADWWKEGNA